MSGFLLLLVKIRVSYEKEDWTGQPFLLHMSIRKFCEDLQKLTVLWKHFVNTSECIYEGRSYTANGPDGVVMILTHLYGTWIALQFVCVFVCI